MFDMRRHEGRGGQVYAEERQHAMAGMIARDRRLSVSTAAESFGVTTETVRRDLAILEQQGLIHRVHGGAVPADALTTVELAVSKRDRTAAAEKDRIARAALDQLPGDGGVILLDAGTTTRRLAAILPADRRLTVFTNTPSIAMLVAGHPSVEVHLVGGRVRPTTHAAVGPTTVQALHNLRVDVSFIGTNGLTVQHGLTTPDADEAAVKAAMIAAGHRVVILTDSRKIGHDTLVRFGTCDQIDALVTDDGIRDEDVTALEALDIDVVIA
jgi:DeoR family transcriptional regulator, fructose operon transcriptional repressor